MSVYVKRPAWVVFFLTWISAMCAWIITHNVVQAVYDDCPISYPFVCSLLQHHTALRLQEIPRHLWSAAWNEWSGEEMKAIRTLFYFSPCGANILGKECQYWLDLGSVFWVWGSWVSGIWAKFQGWSANISKNGCNFARFLRLNADNLKFNTTILVSFFYGAMCSSRPYVFNPLCAQWVFQSGQGWGIP